MAAMALLRDHRLDHAVSNVHRRGVLDRSPAATASWVDRQEFTLSDLLERLSAVSAQLVAAPADAVEIEIRRALDEMRELLQVDRCALCRAAPERDAIDVASQATAPGVEPLPSTMAAAELFAASFGKVFIMNRADDFPPEATVDRESIRATGIKSSIDDWHRRPDPACVRACMQSQGAHIP